MIQICTLKHFFEIPQFIRRNTYLAMDPIHLYRYQTVQFLPIAILISDAEWEYASVSKFEQLHQNERIVLMSDNRKGIIRSLSNELKGI